MNIWTYTKPCRFKRNGILKNSPFQELMLLLDLVEYSANQDAKQNSILHFNIFTDLGNIVILEYKIIEVSPLCEIF